MANSLRLRTKARRIAEQSGNPYGGPTQLRTANRAADRHGLAAVVLVLPLFIFSGIDHGWFGNEGGGLETMQMNMETPSLTPRNGEVVVKLTDWAVTPSSQSVPAGPVNFRAVHVMAAGETANGGGEIHDLSVLQQQADGGYKLIAKTGPISMGDEASLAVELYPAATNFSAMSLNTSAAAASATTIRACTPRSRCANRAASLPVFELRVPHACVRQGHRD